MSRHVRSWLILLIGVVLILIAGCAAAQDTRPQMRQAIGQPMLVSAMCHSVNGRADSSCTPGLFSHSPEVTADAPRYLHTICAPAPPKGSYEKSWIQKRRPPDTYTNDWKRREMAAYGLTDPLPSKNIEEDHIGPLELDGDPGYTIGPKGLPTNLFPQRRQRAGATVLTSAEDKDHEEDLLHHQVCSGALSLQQAQDKIIRDWTE